MAAKIVKGERTHDSGTASSRGIGPLEETGGVVHKRVLDARNKADDILAAAESDAAKIREEAKAVLSTSKAQTEAAVRKGYADGESKGLAKVSEKLMELERLRERFYEGAEPEIVKLSMAIAEKVIGRLASENRDLVKSVVRQALERTLGDRISVRLNPEDYKNLMEGEHDFKDVVDRTKRLVFREDESITRGGCIVESEVGTIDAQLDLQLEAIRKALEIK